MYCMNCGAQIPDQAKFCLNCGAPNVALQAQAPAEQSVSSQKEPPRGTYSQPGGTIVSPPTSGPQPVPPASPIPPAKTYGSHVEPPAFNAETVVPDAILTLVAVCLSALSAVCHAIQFFIWGGNAYTAVSAVGLLVLAALVYLRPLGYEKIMAVVPVILFAVSLVLSLTNIVRYQEWTSPQSFIIHLLNIVLSGALAFTFALAMFDRIQPRKTAVIVVACLAAILFAQTFKDLITILTHAFMPASYCITLILKEFGRMGALLAIVYVVEKSRGLSR